MKIQAFKNKQTDDTLVSFTHRQAHSLFDTKDCHTERGIRPFRSGKQLNPHISFASNNLTAELLSPARNYLPQPNSLD